MEPAALAGLAARLNVESCVLDALGPRQQRLGPGAARWLAEIRQKVFAVAVDNLRRDEELQEALARFDEEGIPFLLLKGSALRAARPGLAGRFQCDVDVLLCRHDLERAESLLVEQGFALDESFRDREHLLSDHFHLALQRNGATVELHWDVDTSSPRGFVERLWAASLPVELDGRTVRVLAPEHELLVACLHLSRHSFFAGLRWLVDLKRLLPVPVAVRERFVAEARLWPVRAVYCPLWTLAAFGVAGAGELPEGLDAGPAERRLLRQLVTAVLTDEPWLGLPAWRGARALRTWLFSERSLFALLAEIWGEGLLRKVQSSRGSALSSG